MIFKRIALLATFLGAACADPVGTSTSNIVYGDDSRLEPHQAPGVHASIARSQVAVRVVDWAVDFADEDAPRITYSRTLAQSEGLCEGQAFAEQIAPGSCSSTLIDERHLLTAAHCVSDADECDGSHYWVFGFEMLESGEMAPLGADDVYTCTRVVVSDGAADFAIVELDRAVEGRTPVTTRVTRGGLPLGSPVVLIGFPSGIPVKVDGGGTVRSSIEGASFRADVDGFSSSSGSGLFDVEGALVGFLQQGARDYVPEGDCNVVNTVPPSAGGGEQVAYLDLALAAYCETDADSSLCTCEGGPCRDPDAGADAGPDGGTADSDAGADAGAPDASMPDASMPDSSTPDAEAPGPSPDPAGGCALGGEAPGSAWLFLAGVALYTRRRRIGR
ncbi:MAG: serine protease [Polyangiales bacterium]